MANFRLASEHQCMNAEKRNTQVNRGLRMNLSLCSWKRKVTSYVNPARSLALQEDEHFIIPEYPSEAQVPGHRDSLIGLFDGHGGRGTVDFVSMALPQNLQKVLRRKEAQENIPRALWAAFLLTDIQTKSCVVDTCSGSTAVCCLLRQIPRTEGGVLEYS